MSTVDDIKMTGPRSSILINIDVSDVERAIAFYTQAFGLTVGRRFDAEFVELLGGNAPLYLLLKRTGTNATPSGHVRRTYMRHWTPMHLDFVVDDLDAATRRAEEAGATLEVEAAEHPYGRIAMLADPFGHGFCLIQFAGRGYDELLQPR